MHTNDWPMRVPDDELLRVSFQEFDQVLSAHLFELELRRFVRAIATRERLGDLAFECVNESFDSVAPQQIVVREPPREGEQRDSLFARRRGEALHARG